MSGLHDTGEGTVGDERKNLEIAVLGPPRLTIAAPEASDALLRAVHCTDKEAAFVVYLAITSRAHPREALAELFWPERPPDQSLANLRVLLSRLRKKLGSHLVVARDAIGLADDRLHVDLRQLHAALDALDADPGGAAERVRAALRGLAPGVLAAGVSVAGSPAFDGWLDTERAALDRRVAAARVLLLELALSRGDVEAAVEHSAAVVAADALDEVACRRHMSLLARAGRRAEALACFDVCRQALAAELEVEPEDETTDLAAALRARQPPRHRVATEGQLERRARTLLLDRVERFWLDQVLETATPTAGAFRLLEQERPDWVASSWSDFGVAPVPEVATVVPTGEPLLTRFEQAGGALLIVGAPGGGKTFRLLELAREAVDAARSDVAAPLPAVLHLGAWPRVEPPQWSDWVSDELRARYHLPRGVVAGWLGRGGLTLLLDGLDELPLDARCACVEAINRSRGEAGLSPIAVCCRTDAYCELVDAGMRLQLEAAIELQPLTPWQVDGYLADTDDHAALAHAFAGDAGWRGLLANPLMLSLASASTSALASASSSTPTAVTGTPDGEATPDALRREVIDGYVDRMLSRGATLGVARRLKTGLRGLARGMACHGQGVFQIESLQPSWLPNMRARLGYLLASRMVSALAFGALTLFPALLMQADGHLIAILVVASVLCAMLLTAVDFGRLHFADRRPVSLSARFALSLAILPVFIAIAFIVGRRFGGPADYGPVLFGFGLVALSVWRPQRVGWRRDIEPVSALAWSWRRALGGVLSGTVVGVVVGGAMFWALTPAGTPLTWRGVVGGAFGPTLMLATIGTILNGLHETAAQELERANVGMVVSLRSAIFAATLMTVGLAVGLAVGVRALAPLLVSFDIQPFFALRHSDVVPRRPIVLVVGVVLGGYAFLWYGGVEVLKHVLVRMFLWRTRVLPLDVPGFLKAAAERGLLRHQATGTIYRHRAVLEHFADEARPESRDGGHPRREVDWVKTVGIEQDRSDPASRAG